MVLGLFFTRNVSLEVWVKSGLIDREKAIYEYHLEQGYLDKIYWFTYGRNDGKYYDDLVSTGRLDPRIVVIHPPQYIPAVVCGYCYWRLLPVLYRKLYRELDVVKSNQCMGAIVAWIVGKMYKIPFYFRTGYTESSFYPFLHGGKKDRKYRQIQRIEKFLYNKCHIAAVSSEHDKKYVCEEYDIHTDKVKLVRNFIDTDKFMKKAPIQDRSDRIVFIGRLSAQKNLFHMLRAAAESGLPLDIYGKGEQREELEKLAQSLKADINFKGTVANDEMPDILNQYKYYILASTYEGMPKTLLEAMACGCICIGTPVCGIAEVIDGEVNGFLAKGTEKEDIVEALRRAYRHDDKDKISDNACKLIKSDYSLTEIARIDRENITLIGKKTD